VPLAGVLGRIHQHRVGAEREGLPDRRNRQMLDLEIEQQHRGGWQDLRRRAIGEHHDADHGPPSVQAGSPRR
jgi:hypothetical protein